LSNLLIIIIIYTILFGTDKFKDKARTSIPIVLGIILVLYSAGALIYKIPNYLVGNASDFLLIMLLLILIFRVEKFKDKSKMAVLLILAAIMLCYMGAILVNLRLYLAEGDWETILDGVGLLLGVFLIIYMVSFLRKK
jgi:tellurite resistance protein TehA-like permease